MNKETGKAEIYPIETFRQVTEVNLDRSDLLGHRDGCPHRRRSAQRGLKRWEPEEMIQGSGRVPGIGLVARQQRPNLLCRRQGGTGRCGRDADEGGDLPRRPLRHHSSRIHRHADGASVGRGFPGRSTSCLTRSFAA